MPCKHAALALIYAKQMAEMDEPWKLWEYRHVGYEKWSNCDANPLWSPIFEYRQIPKTIRIGNYDVPEPMREKPEIGSEYFYIENCVEDGIGKTTWENTIFDNTMLNRGLCHTTKEAALIHAKALFSFSEVE